MNPADLKPLPLFSALSKHELERVARWTDEVDVSEIARRSGDGGGHRQAAGFSSDKSIEEITETLRKEFAVATDGS